MAYDNTNRGVLFPNDKKGNDKAPDFKGTININGEEKQLAAWKKTSEKGNLLSLTVSEPYRKDGETSSQKEIKPTDEFSWP